MKKSWLLIVFFLGGLGGGALWVHAEQDSAETTSDLETVRLAVYGMQSSMCEMGVRSALERLDGVRDVDVDRGATRADVTYDPALVAPTAFVEAVSSVGFRAVLPQAAPTTDTASTVAVQGFHPASRSRLTAEQVGKVVTYVTDRILSDEVIPEGTEIVEATGVELTVADTPLLQQLVVARLSEEPKGRKLLAGSRCSDYGACSLWGNLAGASGDMLQLYREEKARDGESYADLDLAAFTASNLEGRLVHSSDLLGKPAVIALLAVHCTHSMETFPILQELHQSRGPDGLQVVGVLVNSGSVEDANGWVPVFETDFPIWVYAGDDLGDRLGSHLVPTLLLVDSKGRVRKRLVGIKDGPTLLAELSLIEATETS